LELNIPGISNDEFDLPLDYSGSNSHKQQRPYVVPYLKPVSAKQADGTMKIVDELWVKVTAIGGKDTIDAKASDWLARMLDHAKAGRVPSSWPKEFKTALEEWRAGEDLPIKGLPIKSWPPLSPAQRQAVLQAGIQTVEQLAAANDETKARIGMGSLSLVQMAETWLKEAEGPGKMAAQIEQLSSAVATQQEIIERQQKQITELLQILPPEAKRTETIANFAPAPIKPVE
jgi:hypothetical protein